MWLPSNTGLITKLESVQRRFTKSLSDMSSFYYSERLRLLNSDSLEMRRLRADLMLCFKMLLPDTAANVKLGKGSCFPPHTHLVFARQVN